MANAYCLLDGCEWTSPADSSYEDAHKIAERHFWAHLIEEIRLLTRVMAPTFIVKSDGRIEQIAGAMLAATPTLAAETPEPPLTPVEQYHSHGKHGGHSHPSTGLHNHGEAAQEAAGETKQPEVEGKAGMVAKGRVSEGSGEPRKP